MARWNLFTPRSEAVTHTTDVGGFVAAATVLSSARMTKPPKARSTGQAWQGEAWDHLDECGELRYCVFWIAAALSRVRLVAARNPDDLGDEPETLTEGLAAELVAEFAGGIAGQQQLLQRAGAHLVVAGETYLTLREVIDPADLTRTAIEVWQANSTDEITANAGVWKIDDGDGKVTLTEDDLIVRVWRPSPRKAARADSPVRPLLPVLRELQALTRYVSAVLSSRLAGNGLLVLPDTISVPGPGNNSTSDTSDFLTALMTAMTTPLSDPGSAASVVPLTIQVAADAVDQVKHLRFDSPLDSQARDLRVEAIRRVALGMDTPPEVLLGLGSANQWGAHIIDDAAVRLSVAPLAATIAHALTVGWLRPALAAAGETDPDAFHVWFDTSPLQPSGDLSAKAADLYDRMAIGASALRDASGFTDDDAPDDEERTEQVLLKALQAAPSLAPVILPMLGIDVSAADLAEAGDIEDVTDGDAATDPGEDPPDEATSTTPGTRPQTSPTPTAPGAS